MLEVEMIIRVAVKSDLPELAKLYTHSVQALAPQHYSKKQVIVWASFASEGEAFEKFILEPTTFVAQRFGRLWGFSGITGEGHIASLYVHGERTRQGIGSRLLEFVLVYARIHQMGRLYSEASEFSLPLFEKFGFEKYSTEKVVRNGVQFSRYLMQKEESALK